MTNFATTAKEDYEKMLRLKIQCEDFLNKPRCFDCDNLDKLNGNVCKIYGGVPDDHLYEINECPEFYSLIPF